MNIFYNKLFDSNSKKFLSLFFLFSMMWLMGRAQSGQYYKMKYSFTIHPSYQSESIINVKYKTVYGLETYLYINQRVGYGMSNTFSGEIKVTAEDYDMRYFIVEISGNSGISTTNLDCGHYSIWTKEIHNSDCDITVSYYPILTDALNQNIVNNNNNIPISDAITIPWKYVNFPFDVNFQWEFSLDQNNWHTFPPSTYQSGKNQTLTAKELFSGSGMNVNDYIEKYVYIRNRCAEINDPDAVSNTLQYKIVASPPNITIDPIAPKCSTDKGKVAITIDRKLDDLETLHLDLYDTERYLTSTDLKATQISKGVPYICEFDLDQGKTYYINYLSLFKKSDGTNSQSGLIDLKDRSFSIDVPAVTCTISNKTDVICKGGSTGTITLQASGGSQSYKYVLYKDNNSYRSGSFAGENTPSVLYGLPVGTYKIEVTDSNDCPATWSITNNLDHSSIGITEPDKKVNAVINNKTEVTCKGTSTGTITLQASGGSQSYKYTLYKNNASYRSGSFSGENTPSVLSELPVATYKIEVTDSNDCTAIWSVTNNLDHSSIGITEPDKKVNAVINNKTEVTCKGTSTGTITLQASGGSQSYKYTLYKNNASYRSGSFSGENTPSVLSELPVATYKIEVTDSTDCPALWSVTNNLDHSSIGITEPDKKVNAVINNKTEVICKGGSTGTITLQASGGSQSYKYVLYKDNNSYRWGSFAGENTPSVLSGLPVGTYKIEITDSNDCPAIWSVTNNLDHLSIGITEPAIVATATITKRTNTSSIGKIDGSIILEVSGGSKSYKYTLTDKKNNTVIKSESFGSNDSPDTISGLAPGSYSLDVKDTKCSDALWSDLTINHTAFEISDPQPIVVKVTKTDISCHGEENGKISLKAVGGSGSYNYVIEANNFSNIQGNIPSENTEVPIALPGPGTYKVTLKDTNGNDVATWEGVKDHNFIEFNDPSEVTAEVFSANLTCNGADNGEIILKATGGAGGYMYSVNSDNKWTNFTATDSSTISPLKKGIYTIKIKDANNCDAVKYNNSTNIPVVEILDPAVIMTKIVRYDITCNGKQDGKIQLVGTSGGSSDYKYQLYNTIGLYKFGSFSKSETPFTISDLPKGEYKLVLTDLKYGCSMTPMEGSVNPELIVIIEPKPLIFDNFSATPIKCNNGTGTLSAQASGGVANVVTGDYTYSWMRMKPDGSYEDILDRTEVASTYPGLGAGTYKVKVEDSNGNTSESTNTITLTNPEPLAISATIDSVKCHNDSTGHIHFTVTGGTGSYTYLNNDGDTISNNLTRLHAGKYVVTIKDTNGCWLNHEFTVFEPSAPLSVTLARKELSAYHASDAELVATVSGGTFSSEKPCSFDWTGSGSKTKTASGLASGTYKLTVTDNNTCTAEASATFIDPLKVDIVVKDSISCYGKKGELAARAVGGEPSLTGLPYKYTWYQVKDGVSTLLYPGDSNDSLATNLPEGYYSVKIDDNHGRILQTTPFHLTQPEMVQISVDSTNVSCKGDNNGSIKVTATGGNGGYTYLWEDGSTQNERTNLSPGKYTIQVFDRKNCQPIPASRTITITEPDKLTLSLQKTDVLVACDGKIESIASGGIRPYRFRWNDGEETVDSVKTLLCDGNYKVQVIDKNLCTATASILLPPPLVVKISVQDSVNCFGDNNGSLVVYAQGGVPYKTGKPYKYSWKKQTSSGIYEVINDSIDSNLRGLTAGWYALNITDSIGVSLRADSVFYLPQPEALAIRIQKTDVLCHGASTGAISAVVTGGLKPYHLLWNTGSTDTELQNIKAGVYTITATDRNGCTKQYTATIDQSDSLIIGFTNTVAPLSANSCDGLLTASVLGGVGPYTYQWNPNNTSGATVDKLCSGSYTVTVNDMFGCPAQVTKNLNDAPPPFVASLYVKDSISCHGASTGMITARVLGGIPFTTGNPYTYIWKKKNSAGEYRSVANGNDSIVGNLTSGWYTFNVQDADKNILSESIEIYLPEPDTLALTVSHTDIPCKNLHNGSASVRVSGGVLPYAYKWSNGETTPSIDNLAPGEYWIEVTDRHSCISRQSVTVTEPDLLSVTFQPKLISEHNVCDGSLKAVVTGGTAPFSYAWSGVNSTADAVSSLCAGEYSVTVTDAHGCSANQKIALSNPPALRLSLVVQDSIKCNGNVQGILVATAQGGVPFAYGASYRYTWKKKNSRGVFETMPAYTDSIATDLATGTYACTITDANGISLHQDSVILLPEPTELQLAIQQTNIGCSGAAEGSATVIPSGGSLPYSYAWSTGDKTATVRNLSAGPYIVRVTDRNGCVAARQMYISKAAPLYLFLYKKQPVCYQSCDGEIKTTVSGGIAPYSFRWTGSASTGSEAGSLCAGKYSLLVTDATGCTIQKNDSLQHPAQLPLQLGKNRYICSGQTIRYDISIPSKTGITYNWTGSNGFTATTPAVALTQAGIYTASVTDATGCSNSGSVTLSPSGTTVANEFALPTQAFVNERIVIVNTTYPAPDSIRWVLPAKAQILSCGQSYTEFQVPNTGVYVIKMISYKGVCSSEQEKEIIVSARSQLSDIGNAKTPFIQAFSVTPNPSHGELTTKVVLQDKAVVQLKLINILSNQIVFQERKSGDSTYEVSINVTVLPGIYLLLLETPKGSSTMKVIIF